MHANARKCTQMHTLSIIVYNHHLFLSSVFLSSFDAIAISRLIEHSSFMKFGAVLNACTFLKYDWGCDITINHTYMSCQSNGHCWYKQHEKMCNTYNETCCGITSFRSTNVLFKSITAEDAALKKERQVK